MSENDRSVTASTTAKPVPEQPERTAPLPSSERSRIEIIDLLRTIALFAMVVFHFTWDLEFFNYVERGLTEHGAWRDFARIIASSFLFLVGVSLILAHGRGVRWRSFAIRLGQIAAGALAVTIATYVATPNAFVYFGILHQIVFASLAGLLFLRFPWWLTGLCAALVVALPSFVSSPAFDPSWLDWIGFFEKPPVSNDFVPVFPFFGAVLAGMALTKLASNTGVLGWLAGFNAPLQRFRFLTILGRHTLILYLLHQPVLFGAVYAASLVAPPDLHAVFQTDCRAACLPNRDDAFCERYCGCAGSELDARGLFDALMNGDPSKDEAARISEVTRICSFRSSE